MSPQRPGYQVYLLRLWEVRNGEQAHWRASLESARAGENYGFGSLEALFEFLRAKTESTSDPTAEVAEDAKKTVPLPFPHREGAGG